MKLTTPIPTTDGSSFNIDHFAGQSLFIVGANGSGKSSLMHHFYSTHSTSSRRISAHRQTWFGTNAITLSPSEKRNTETYIKGADSNPQARWKDDYSAQRASMAIYDLIDAENVRARAIANAVDNNEIDDAKALSNKDSPVRSINELLRLSNIPIEISIHENEHVLASKRGGPTYSVAELSDGERNALLIAANVLTAPPSTLFLIDEPERHLHRSIIAPLLTSLFKKREDCAFVISTHDITLPQDNPVARTLLVRGCTYSDQFICAWDIDLLEYCQDLDEELQRDVLGARRRILFVEGEAKSLDSPLYALIFPNVSVLPKKSCRDVIHAVNGLRAVESLQWVSAFGLIDNDRRVQEDIDTLRREHIYALPVFSVESIYYHSEIQDRLVKRMSSVTGSNPSSLLTHATDAAISAIKIHARRLAERAVERTLRDELEKQMPTRKSIAAGTPLTLNIDIQSAVEKELSILIALIENRELHALIARYPIRETSALDEIARKIGFQGRIQYESAVQKLLMDDDNALSFVRAMFADLNDALK